MRNVKIITLKQYSIVLYHLLFIFSSTIFYFALVESVSKAYSDEFSGVLKPIHVSKLGDGWAGNTVNTVIFRHHGILTWKDLQFTSFYSQDGKIRFVKRNLKSNQINISELRGRYNPSDAHNSISMGIDKKGFLHISYNQHVGPLHYRRSKIPFSIDQWTDELQMTGKREARVTYPTFIMPNKDGGVRLLFLYRNGYSGKGDAYLKEYDETSRKWYDIEPCILSGSEQKPSTNNPYWNHPAIDRAGGLHLTFVWRTHSPRSGKTLNNINIDYAKSKDWGHRWHSSRGREFHLPITQINSETIQEVPSGLNLINQCSSAIDSHGHPHIVFYADDCNGIPQYQHLWFDGREWRTHIVSERTKPFDLEGSGTLQIPMSRPEIVIDKADHIYVIYRSDTTGDQMVATRLIPPHYEKQLSESKILWEKSLGFAEPVLDRIRWRKEQILSMLIQKNNQPDHDFDVSLRAEPIYIVDWDLVNDLGADRARGR